MHEKNLKNHNKKLKEAEDWLEEYDIGLLIQLEKYRLKDTEMYSSKMFSDRLVKLILK